MEINDFSCENINNRMPFRYQQKFKFVIMEYEWYILRVVHT